MRVGGQTSITVSSSHWQCTVSVGLLVIAELAKGAGLGAEISNQFLPWPGFEPQTFRLVVQHTNH